MALYDQRTFRHNEQWWAAEVHMASGGGYAEGDVEPVGPAWDTVFLTCISDEEARTRVSRIPSGYLNRLSHRAMVRELQEAEEQENLRMDMSPHNMPDPMELEERDRIRDEDGLPWVYRPAEVVAVQQGEIRTGPGIEVICLHDSALRREVWGGADDYDAIIQELGEEGIADVIRAVKSLFVDDPQEIDGWVPPFH